MLKTTKETWRGLLERERILTLAVIADAFPTLVRLLFQPAERAVMVNASRLSLHSRALCDGGRAGIVIHEQDAADEVRGI